MRKIVLQACLFACSLPIYSQDFPGIRSSNYSGVNSVFYNPANLADNRYKFSLNILSLNASVANDQLSYKLKTIGQTLDEDKLKDQFMGSTAGRTNAMLGLALNGPSFSFTAGPKLGIGVTSRGRVFGTITNFEGKLFGSSDDDEDNTGIDPTLPYTFQKGADMKVAAHVFSEVGLSGAYVLMNKDEHFIKTGLTLKYLIGVGNAFYNFNNLTGTIDEEGDDLGPYLTNAQGRVAVGMGGINVDAADFGDLLTKRSGGFGTDIGFVYEFRPDYGGYNGANGINNSDKNKYKLRLSVSVHDIGNIKYDKDPDQSADYTVNISPAQRLYLDDIGADDDQTINEYFASRPDIFTPVASNTDLTYKVSLPTTLNIEVDYQLHSRLYLNLFTQLAMSGKASDPYNNKLYSTVALTPRFETKAFGFYLPIQYNGLTKMNVGASFRFGPLFVGSGSVVTALLGNSKQADVHVGLMFGSLQKSKKAPLIDPNAVQ